MLKTTETETLSVIPLLAGLSDVFQIAGHNVISFCSWFHPSLCWPELLDNFIFSLLSLTRPERRKHSISPWKINASRSLIRWYCRIPSRRKTGVNSKEINKDHSFLIEKIKAYIQKVKTIILRESNGRISEEIKKMLEIWKSMERNIKDHLEYSL